MSIIFPFLLRSTKIQWIPFFGSNQLIIQSISSQWTNICSYWGVAPIEILLSYQVRSSDQWWIWSRAICGWNDLKFRQVVNSSILLPWLGQSNRLPCQLCQLHPEDNEANAELILFNQNDGNWNETSQRTQSTPFQTWWVTPFWQFLHLPFSEIFIPPLFDKFYASPKFSKPFQSFRLIPNFGQLSPIFAVFGELLTIWGNLDYFCGIFAIFWIFPLFPPFNQILCLSIFRVL